jgi:hypothetical protein
MSSAPPWHEPRYCRNVRCSHQSVTLPPALLPKQHFYEVSNLRGLLYVISSSLDIYAVTFVCTLARSDIAVQ